MRHFPALSATHRWLSHRCYLVTKTACDLKPNANGKRDFQAQAHVQRNPGCPKKCKRRQTAERYSSGGLFFKAGSQLALLRDLRSIGRRGASDFRRSRRMPRKASEMLLFAVPGDSACFFGSRRKSQSPAFAFSGLGKAFAGTGTSKKKAGTKQVTHKPQQEHPKA